MHPEIIGLVEEGIVYADADGLIIEPLVIDPDAPLIESSITGSIESVDE